MKRLQRKKLSRPRSTSKNGNNQLYSSSICDKRHIREQTLPHWADEPHQADISLDLDMRATRISASDSNTLRLLVSYDKKHKSVSSLNKHNNQSINPQCGDRDKAYEPQQKYAATRQQNLHLYSLQTPSVIHSLIHQNQPQQISHEIHSVLWTLNQCNCGRAFAANQVLRFELQQTESC